MCALPARGSACWLEGESEEELFKQKYRLENKQRIERAIEKMCACVCARVSVCLCVCARARQAAGSPGCGAKNNPVRAGAPPPPSCPRRRRRGHACGPGFQRAAADA